MNASHVLVPLDGSPFADDALAHALSTFDCRLTVLKVVTPLDSSMSEGGVLDADRPREAGARDRADAMIEQAADDVEAAGRDVTLAVETGDPAETIVEYVAANDVDHVVIGGQGGSRTDLRRRLLGTVTTKVVGEVPVPVTVIQ